MNTPIEVLAYLAGVLDSDGYIGIHRSTYAQRVRGDATQAIYQTRIQVKQVDFQAVDLFLATFGGHRYLQAPSSTKGRRLWTWQVHSAATKPVLEALFPHLRIKRNQAANALEVCRLNRLPKRFPVPVIEDGEALVTIPEAAKRLGKSRAVVAQAVAKGSVPSLSDGVNRFIPESYLPIWEARPRTPRRAQEVTEELERRFELAKAMNRGALV